MKLPERSNKMVDTLIVFVETHEKFAFHLHAKEYSYFLTNLIYIQGVPEIVVLSARL